MLFTLLTLPALVVGLPSIGVRQDYVRHMPLVRRTFHGRGDLVDLDRIARSIGSLKSKYGLKTPYGPGLGRRASEADIGTIDQASHGQAGSTSYHTDLVCFTGW